MGTFIRLDIDRKIYSGASRIYRVCSILRLRIISSNMKRSRHGNFHWIIEVENSLTPIQVICVQALMGSDFKRECFNLLRASQFKDKSDLTKEHSNILFKRKNTTADGSTWQH